MNCALAREQLLASDHPGRPAQALAAHLSDCVACRAVQWRLERLERDLLRLRVPPCPPPGSLMERVLYGPEQPVVRPTARAGHEADRRQGGRQKLALAFALAASLAVFALSWGALSRPGPPPPPKLRDQHVAWVNAELRHARTPREKVARLTEMADELLDQAKTADPARLEDVAKQVEWLTTGDLALHAERVPAAERKEALRAAAQSLAELESKAAHLEGDARRRGDGRAARSLHQISKSLGEANRHLRRLAEERV